MCAGEQCHLLAVLSGAIFFRVSPSLRVVDSKFTLVIAVLL